MAQESGATRLVLVGGHESDDGRDLSVLAESLPAVSITQAGRPLHNAVSALLAVADGPVAVLPMTFGRNPTMVADTAKSLKWLDAGPGAQRVALCEDFGTPDHLVAWLRRAATETARRRPGTALVIAARSANPFDDAELHRTAHLVRAHGAGGEVEVACLGGEPEAGLREAVRRVRLLGSEETVVVPAGFARTLAAPFGQGAFRQVEFYGPLMSDQAIRQVIAQRRAAAEHRLGHGESGIDAGLLADHGHGYAHSHSFEEGQGHSHQHGHSHPHKHGHPHKHTHGNGHSHTAGQDTDGHRPPRQAPSQEQASSRDEDLSHRH